MLTAVKGIYDNGIITLSKDAPVQTKTEVIVTFLSENKELYKQRIPGGLKGKVSLPDDFNELLEDMNDYMWKITC